MPGRIKGTQVADLAAAVQELKLGDRMPEHLRRYLSERVLASNWYPESDFRDLMLLVGHASQAGVEGSVWHFMGRMGAARDCAGAYAAWISEGNPSRTLQQLPRGWRAVRDTGTLSVTAAGENAAEVSLVDYPVMCRELAEVNLAYIQEMLRQSGAKKASVRLRRLTEAGARWLASW